MKRAVTAVCLGLAMCSPPGALAAASWAAARIEPVHGRIVPLTSVVREQQSRVEVTETATARTFAVPSDVLFAFDSSAVGKRGVAALRALAPQVADGTVTVVGHTDARGDDAYNERLASRRAHAVADVLRAAVDGVVVETRAMGERDPVAANRTADGRRRNRRVELVVPRRADG